jgi:hypothetical protein
MDNVLDTMTSNDSELVAGTSEKGVTEVKPPSHTVLPRLSGDSDPRTRKANQDLLLRKIRRLRRRIKEIRNESE